MMFLLKAAALYLALSSSFGFDTALAATSTTSPQWHVSYDDKLCMLWRNYGQGNSPMMLGIKPSMTGDATRLYVIYPGGPATGRWSETRLIYDGREIPLQFIDLPASAKGKRIAVISMPAAQLAPALGASRWSFRSQWMHGFDFQVDGLASATARLDRCVQDLTKRWKLDAESQSKIAQPVQGNIAQYFSNDDYPSLALYLRKSGTTGMRFLVGSDGRVMDCSISESSGSAVLDYTACAKLKERAILTPAKDSSGEPVVSVMTTSMRWVLH